MWGRLDQAFPGKYRFRVLIKYSDGLLIQIASLNLKETEKITRLAMLMH